jgi:hypothetical protein
VPPSDGVMKQLHEKREKDVTRPIRHGNSGNIVKRGKTKKNTVKKRKKKVRTSGN